MKDPSTEASSRRRFLGKVLAGASTAAVAGLLQSPSMDAAGDAKICVANCVAPGTAGGTNCGMALEPIGEIHSVDGVMQALMIVAAENRSVPYLNQGFPLSYDCRIVPLRAYQGYQGFKETPSQLRTKPPVMTPGGLTRLSRPGPTLRAKVGDLVQIAFLNRIDEKNFFKTVTKDACDVVTGVYPGTDVMPNCFHGGNTTNLHFHGTHVSPSKFADNVLIQVMPDPKAKADWVIDMLNWIKDHPGQDPEIDPKFKNWKANANKRLTAKEPGLTTADEHLEMAGEWPEYWEGAYPYSFTIPKYEKGKMHMGQAPGTHWYHAHKHGAAALQMLNGLSGAFIIEGDYDRELREALPGIQEKVMVFQQYDSLPNEERPPAGRKAALLQVNGQLMPTVMMRPGEIQWWRIVNGTIQANQINTFGFLEAPVQQAATQAAVTAGGDGPPRFTIPPVGARGTIASFRPVARDGVQFAWQNYDRRKADTEFRLAQGNRIDILVQAPQLTDGKPIDMVLVYAGLGQSRNATAQNTVLRVRVENGGGPPVPTQFPSGWEPDPNDPTKPRGKYLTFPEWLGDIEDSELSPAGARTVTFTLKAGTNVGAQPKYEIDGKQFEDGYINQCMSLNTAQEWTVGNTTTVPHPYHIHVNPFQIVASKKDATSDWAPLPKPWVWQDTIEVPTGGAVKIRSRFVDFTGKFVLHCHILGHEDRGMMQLVEVREGACPATPYKTALTHGH